MKYLILPLITVRLGCEFLRKNVKKIPASLKNDILKVNLPSFNIKSRILKYAALSMSCLMFFSMTVLTSGAVLITNPDVAEQNNLNVSNIVWKADLAAYRDPLAIMEYGVKSDADTSEDLPNGYHEIGIPDRNSNPAVTAPTTIEASKAPVTTSILIVEPAPDVTAPAAQEKPAANASPGDFSFTTYGYGHGVGMPQNGANFYAKYGGYNYRQILEHYYPGVTIAQTGITDELIYLDGEWRSMLDAVAGITAHEVSTSFSVEAIKAQAVAAYTMCKYNKNDATLAGMAYKTPPQAILDAVSEVLGEACYYNGNYAMTVFGASSSGATANARDVWGGDVPYLVSVPSIYDAVYDPHYGTVRVMAAKEVRERVEKKFGVTLAANPNLWFETIKGDGGFITSVVLETVSGPVTVKGYAFRTALGLKAQSFDLSYGG